MNVRFVQRSLLNTGIFLAALVCSFVLARLAFPDPFDARKFDEYQAFESRFDTVFIGSSCTEYGVDPEAFDRAAGTSSFNLANSGAKWNEIDWTVRGLLKSSQPRYVIIEYFSPEIPLPEYHFFTSNTIDWHSLDQTWKAIRIDWRIRERGDRLRIAVIHLLHFAKKNATLSLHRRAARRPVPHFSRGFDAARADSEEKRKQNAAFLADIDKYRRLLQDAAGFQGLDGDHRFSELIRQQARFVLDHGAIPVYWTPPRGADCRQIRRMKSQGAIPYLLHFDDPVAYPELFEVDRRLDAYHLNAEGAELMARMLGERFRKEVLGAAPRPAPPTGAQVPAGRGGTNLAASMIDHR